MFRAQWIWLDTALFLESSAVVHLFVKPCQSLQYISESFFLHCQRAFDDIVKHLFYNRMRMHVCPAKWLFRVQQFNDTLKLCYRKMCMNCALLCYIHNGIIHGSNQPSWRLYSLLTGYWTLLKSTCHLPSHDKIPKRCDSDKQFSTHVIRFSSSFCSVSSGTVPKSSLKTSIFFALFQLIAIKLCHS
jgi:hypothetical protein